MITDGKRLVDMTLSTATLCSFAIPGAGAVVASVFGASQLLFDIFCPEAPVDPNAQPPTVADLTNAMNQLAVKVDESVWQADLALLQQSVMTHNDIFMMFWNWMSLVKLDKIIVEDSSPGTNDGGTYIADLADEELVENLDTYFNATSGPLVALKTALGVLSNPSDKTSTPGQRVHRRTENTALYCLTASTLIAYCKSWVIWEWGHNHVLKYNAYTAFDKQNRLYWGKDAAYRANHSLPISPLKAGEKAPKEPDWNAWRKSGPVTEMLAVIDQILLYAEVGDGTDLNPALYTTMRTNWYTDRPQKVRDRLGKLSLQNNGAAFWYFDSETGETSPNVPEKALAELHLEAKSGSLIAYYWDYWSDTYGLDTVTEDAISRFGDTIQLWKAARASVNFRVHEVQPGDTLGSIAAHEKDYKSSLYDKAIFDANQQSLTVNPGTGYEWERVTLTEGQVLTLPDKSTVGFTTYTMTAADNFPHTFVNKFAVPYDTAGKISYNHALSMLNWDVATKAASGGAIPAGTEIRLPAM